MLFEIPLLERVLDSDYVIEGHVVSKRSFWDDKRQVILTANRVVIEKILKGGQLTGEIEILTRGGFVGNEGQTVFPSLQFEGGETGMFFLMQNREGISQNILAGVAVFEPVAGPQGAVIYDLDKGIANDVFYQYDDIEQTFYELLSNMPGIEIENWDAPELKEAKGVGAAKIAASITSFTPSSISSGTKSVLTINGTGFGSTQGTGKVEFSNADNGGASINVAPLAAEYVSWSDTKIEVEVPSKAGTGNFEVIPDGGGTGTSPSSLIVTYAQLNATHASDTWQTQHVNDDGLGGYTWERHTDFAASDAAAPFLRSLETWCGATNIYWTIGNNTTKDVAASDGTNIVRFDNGSELPGGVLGRCTTYWNGCSSGGGSIWYWYVIELDIVFNDDTNWYYGTGTPGGGQYDFETVSVHELGHGHQLGHVIDGSAVMHYAVSSGATKRNPNANEITGASDVYSRSTTTAVCGQPLMSTGINCSALLLPVELVSFRAIKQAETTLLVWQTAAEINNDYFIVQRSIDGAAFQDLGRINGAGFSNELIDYEFTDTSPLDGRNYYRLKQIDFNGSFEYSLVQVVDFESSKIQFTIYPNPISKGELHTVFTAPFEGESILTIIDDKGMKIFAGRYFLKKGMNEFVLPSINLLQGLYWVSINFNGNVINEKFVKL